MVKKNITMVIEISNIDEAQKIAIEDMLSVWENLGDLGDSATTTFYADGDGGFKPKILVDGEKAKYYERLNKDILWASGDYNIFYAWLYELLEDPDYVHEAYNPEDNKIPEPDEDGRGFRAVEGFETAMIEYEKNAIKYEKIDDFINNNREEFEKLILEAIENKKEKMYKIYDEKD